MENQTLETNNEDRGTVWRRIAVVSLLLLVLVGPNFGPIPSFLGQVMSVDAAVITLLFTFTAGFVIILAIIQRMLGGMPVREMLRSFGLGAPSRLAANIVGAVVGILWGLLFMSSILQFAPETNLANIDLLRVVAALLAAFGALLEDLITRGFLMNQMKKISVPGWAQALISALVFAIYHTALGFNVFSFAFSIVYGLILAGLFLWGKRSLTPVILAHSLAVLISEPFATMLIFIAPGA
ncbi:MAG: CPBP family intramembrane metalloprotease [Chloroflexi bacterium]|nr:CPBP family intramembrane metalloprotease [Chloroflexota bacterium]